MDDIPVGSIARCIFAFTSEEPNELSVVPGEFVTVFTPSHEGWNFCARLHKPDEEGNVPSSFLKLELRPPAVPTTSSSAPATHTAPRAIRTNNNTASSSGD